MGTKNKPGDFDCYANAEMDEPMFILLARDGMAPSLVDAWADARERAGEDYAKVKEARQCADSMRDWLAKKHKSEKPVGLAQCVTAHLGATCFDVLEDAQNDLASPNNDRYDPEARTAILRGEKMCRFCRSIGGAVITALNRMSLL